MPPEASRLQVSCIHKPLFAVLALSLPAALPGAVHRGHDPATMSLVTQDSIVFLGIAGDYSADGGAGVPALLAAAELPLVGEPLRSFTKRDRQIWAVRTDDPEHASKRAASRLKRHGFSVVPLRVSALTLLDRASGSALKRAVRDAELSASKVWGASLHPQYGLLWVFHEEKLGSEEVLRIFRKGRLNPGFYHQEIRLEAADGTDMAVLVADASAKLDLVRAVDSEKELVLDLYFRDVGSLLALHNGKTTYACPDVRAFLDGAPGALHWQVTLDNRGYPFLD